MKCLRTRARFFLYGGVLVCLVAATALAVRFVAGSGAYLTSDGDWQELAGEYRIGVIDYAVDVNGQTLISQGADKNKVDTYQMVVPLRGGVHTFDTTVSVVNREKEFNEGATLARVRVTNRSDSMIEVTAAAKMLSQSPGAHLRVLPLPVELDLTAARNLNYRQYVLSTLGVAEKTSGETEAQAVARLDAAYDQYWRTNADMTLPLGILHGATTGQDGTKSYFFKDAFLLLWSEYSEEYNQEGAAEEARWGRLQATFTVGQLE